MKADILPGLFLVGVAGAAIYIASRGRNNSPGSYSPGREGFSLTPSNIFNDGGVDYGFEATVEWSGSITNNSEASGLGGTNGYLYLYFIVPGTDPADRDANPEGFYTFKSAGAKTINPFVTREFSHSITIRADQITSSRWPLPQYDIYGQSQIRASGVATVLTWSKKLGTFVKSSQGSISSGFTTLSPDP